MPLDICVPHRVRLLVHCTDFGHRSDPDFSSRNRAGPLPSMHSFRTSLTYAVYQRISVHCHLGVGVW